MISERFYITRLEHFLSQSAEEPQRAVLHDNRLIAQFFLAQTGKVSEHSQ